MKKVKFTLIVVCSVLVYSVLLWSKEHIFMTQYLSWYGDGKRHPDNFWDGHINYDYYMEPKVGKWYHCGDPKIAEKHIQMMLDHGMIKTIEFTK